MSQSVNFSRDYQSAKARYAALGVDVERALRQLARIPISLQCWQGDDVVGFENLGGGLGGGLAVTGNYPGKARTADELRADLAMALALIPGKHRVNLHAMYGEFGGAKVDRNEIGPEHFAGWVAWALEQGVGLDFNPTCFSHPKAADGFTLSHRDKSIRNFWIEHCAASRQIAAAIGRGLKSPCLNNVWIPDGMKDTPVDRRGARERLMESLDAVFRKKFNPHHMVDSVEPKLFGIGSESFVVGSHEFYLGYAVSRKVLLTLDSGHYHPTECIADKISAAMLYLQEIALHVSRGVRWDSDHVVTLTDDLQAIAQEIVWGGHGGRVRLGLDYFDATINRVASWVIGTRNLQKALLLALLTPLERLKKFETEGDYTARLVLLEESKTLPFGAVWTFYCDQSNVPPDHMWLPKVKRYEREVLSRR